LQPADRVSSDSFQNIRGQKMRWRTAGRRF